MQKKRNLLGLILFLMTLGSGLYSVFVPIYYLNHGVSFLVIKLFFIAFLLGGIIGGIFNNFLMHRWGVKLFIILRGIFEPLIVLLIRSYPTLRYPIYLQGFLSGFVAFSYWISMDVITLIITDRSKRGSQQGTLYGLMWTATILSPFLGGAIIKFFSYPVLFIISFALVLGGGFLSFKLNIKSKIKKKFNLLPSINGKIGYHMFLVFVRGVNFPIAGWVFALLVYWAQNDEFFVGLFGLILGASSLLSNVITGKLLDKYNKINVYLVINLLIGLAWFLFFVNIPIYIPMLFVYFLFFAASIPSNTTFFDYAEKMDIVSLSAERMIAFCTGGVLILAFYIFFPLNVLYIISALFMGISLIYINKLKN